MFLLITFCKHISVIILDMNILDLPIEVGVLIFTYLDTKSKINAYCSGLKNYFAPSHVKKLVFSRSTLATAKSLNQSIFLDFRKHIHELDLSGVPDLNAYILKPHIKHLETLNALDISFTNIYLSDLHEICPNNLKNISINFFKTPRRCGTDVWEKSQSIFKENAFDNVHFIVFEFDDSDMPLVFLKDVPPIKDLKITIADNYEEFWETDEQDSPLGISDAIPVNFDKVSYLFRDCYVSHKTAKALKGISLIDFDEIEYIFIMYLEKIYIYVSTAFRGVFSENCADLKVIVSSYLPLDFMLDGNIFFKAWNKSTINFDEEFYKDLVIEFKDYFPTYVCMHNNVQMKVVDSISTWFSIDSCEKLETLENVPEKVIFTDFCRKDGVMKKQNRPISINPDLKTFENITFLRLSNITIKNDFFHTLFSVCTKLSTIDIYIEKRGLFYSYMSSLKSIKQAKNLKNMKITAGDIDYEILFGVLKNCVTFENIHICDYERTLEDDVDVKYVVQLMKTCEELYSLFIETEMAPESLTLIMSRLREAVQCYHRDYLCVEVCECFRGWNPFTDVFNPSPLQVLD